MMLWSLKKAVPLTIVYSFLLFVCFPMYITLTRNSMRNVDNFKYGETMLISMEFVAFLIVIFTIVTACFMFGVYHKKRSIDLYASFPVNKHKLFLAKYFSGLLITIVPLAVFMTLGLFAGHQVNSINTFITFYRLFANVISIINMYSMLALLSMICGGRVDTLVTFGILNFAFIAFFQTSANLVASIVPGLFNMDVQIYEPFTFMLFFTFCPVAMPFVAGAFSSIYADVDGSIVNYIDENMLDVETKVLVIWFAIAVVYFVIAIFMAKKRRNENVQNGFIFNFPKHIIHAIASLAFGMFFGGFLAGNFCTELDGFKTMLMFMLGALIGTVLSYLVVTLVFNKGAKRFIKGLPIFVGTFVALAVFYLSISSGLVGVSSVPKVESIKSVCVLGDNDQTFNTDLSPIIHSRGNGFEKVDLFMEDKEVIKNTVALHQAILDGLHDEAGTFLNFYNNYTAGGGNGDTGYEPYTIRIEYELNNGKKISKTYINGHYSYDKIKDKYNAVISSDVYKQECYKLAKCDVYDANVCRIDFYSHNRYKKEDIDNVVLYSEEASFIDGKPVDKSATLSDFDGIKEIYSTLREEFIADKNYAETLKADYCEYVEPTDSNSAIYDEIVFDIQVAYNEDNYVDVYGTIDRQAEKLGVIPGEYILDPAESFVITKETYPKTWELLNSYCEQENTNNVCMFADTAVELIAEHNG